MFHRSCPVVILALVLTLAAASAQQAPTNPVPSPAIPDTPAGHTLKAWFDSFNSGERALIDAYIHKYDPDKSVDREMQFRSMTGGFVLLQIMKSEPGSIGISRQGTSQRHPRDWQVRCQAWRSRDGGKLWLARDSSRHIRG